MDNKSMLKIIFRYSIFSILFCSQLNIAFAYTLPDGFTDDINSSISKTLMNHNIRGCGYLAWKNTKYPREYHVMCSRDGENWRPYTVWDLSNDVMQGHQ